MFGCKAATAILQAAEGLFVELGKRNPEATMWAVRGAFPKATAQAIRVKVEEEEGTPCFMAHTRATVHAETIHHIVSAFVA